MSSAQVSSRSPQIQDLRISGSTGSKLTGISNLDPREAKGAALSRGEPRTRQHTQCHDIIWGVSAASRGKSFNWLLRVQAHQ